MCPGNDESAGKRRTGKTRKGSKWLSQTLVECAKSANRSKNTYLAAQYARLRARRGANKATIAVCHSILTAVWHMLSTGETYTDPGGDFFARRDPERTRKRLVGQLERLGYTVTAAGRGRGSLNEIFSTQHSCAPPIECRSQANAAAQPKRGVTTSSHARQGSVGSFVGGSDDR